LQAAGSKDKVGTMLKVVLPIVLAGSLPLIGRVTADAADSKIKQKPRPGFVLVAWDEESHANPRAWESSIRRIFRVGVRDVTVVTYRFVDAGTGNISASSAHGLESPPSDAVVLAALREGKRLGMRVSVNPLVEIDDPKGIGSEWRGDLSFAGAQLDGFFANYREYVHGMAELVKSGGGHRLYIGSELKSLAGDRDARPLWSELIQDVRQVLPPPVKLSYASNFDNAAKIPFWSELDEIAIDAYYSLATSSEAAGRGNPTIDVIREGWRGTLEKIRKLSDKHKKRVVFSEWGVVPFDETTVRPWDWTPSPKKDFQEQFNAYQATLDAVEPEGQWLTEITFWHWAMSGNEGSHYRIGAESRIVQRIAEYAGHP
jgi:hypothetical protein